MANTENIQSWEQILATEFAKQYYLDLEKFVAQERKTKEVFPPKDQTFNAFKLCGYSNTKVVILGQDPYHNKGQAHGLCFSVPEGFKIPPSLRNIYKELYSDLGKEPSLTGDLTNWAKQGVLLLNATLTVQAHMPASHQKQGWEQFTDNVIKLLNSHKQNLVFILWGGYARKKAKLIDVTKHLILESAHPSPLSAYNGFYGNKHFSKCNKYLEQHAKKQINW